MLPAIDFKTLKGPQDRREEQQACAAFKNDKDPGLWLCPTPAVRLHEEEMSSTPGSTQVFGERHGSPRLLSANSEKAAVGSEQGGGGGCSCIIL